MSKSSLFKFINKDGEGLVTRKDFEEMLSNVGMKEVSQNEIKRFIDYFYKDEKGGVDLKSFLRIFDKFEKQLDMEEDPSGGYNRKPRAPVAPAVLAMKKRVFEELDQACRQEKVTLRTLFKTMDRDGNLNIDVNELSNAFRRMKVKVTDSEMRAIFKSIDFDDSGSIDWSEFKHDFDRCISKSQAELEQEDRLLSTDFNEDPSVLSGSTFGKQGDLNTLKELEYKRKIDSLTQKVKQAHLEISKSLQLKALTEESYKLLERHHNDLRKQFDFNSDEYFKLQKECQILKEKNLQSIGKAESEALQRSNTALKMEVAETRAALLSYKSMHNVVAEQVKSLKVMHERNKDENESLITTLRDLQSENFDKQKYGKLYYVVMLSRWQEAAVNKKYAMKLGECKELRGELLDSQQLLENKERDLHQAECDVQRSKQQMVSLK